MDSVFCVDLDESTLEVKEFGGSELKEDLEFFGFKNPKDLNTFDRRIFNSVKSAQNYIAKFKETEWRMRHAHLGNRAKLMGKSIPCMLYKRRYLVQTLMREKLHTIRSYRKPWENGQVFQLHDQTHFVLVKLKSISEINDGQGRAYRYDFELC